MKVKVRVRGEVRVRILVRRERGLRPNRCRASLLLAVCLSTKLSICLDAPAALAHIVWRAEDDGDALVHVLRHLVRVRVRVGVRVRVRVRVGVRVGVRVKVRVRVSLRHQVHDARLAGGREATRLLDEVKDQG
eukprot:scaffold65595_cov27-Phaeocystis_antarctica.AAC.1